MAQRFPRWIPLFLCLAMALTAGATTTRNDDSCDIAVLPAATLLLPYFEVDLDDPRGETTLVTITNVTNLDAIARVTLWTDRGYPVFTFNVFLTGYDVQPLNLYDILGRGVIASNPQPRGPLSDPNAAIGTCDDAGLWSAEAVASAFEFGSDERRGYGSRHANTQAEAVASALQNAFTTGSIPGQCEEIGGVHENATGYATIDVVGNCSANTPRDPRYWITDLRFDNILIGDYQQLGDAGAQGAPLVHIRAVPEGTTRTFYARYTTRDRRQPLPSQFAVRWTEGTSLKIWREGRAGMDATCGDYASDVNLAVADIVTFDEEENAIGLGHDRVELTASTKTAAADPLLPQLANGAPSGWIYLNLDRSARDEFASQAWVVSSTRVEGRYASDVDAVALANGCAAPAERGQPIAPANDDDSCDIALLPAATLLLPYFEVDLDDPEGETAIFTVTNVSPKDQIARVTLWTDYAYPVITFNIYLTGYDVQSIDLYDVLARGRIAPDEGTGTQITERGPRSGRNVALDLGHCARLVGHLSAEHVRYMQSAFTHGTVPSLGVIPGCNNIGEEHANAAGYATIDVVRNCSGNDPLAEHYWTEDIAWDNVLIGDYHQVHSANDLAQGSTMVHIRAIPGARFPRTFYARYQSASAPKRDARQPLPSVFAARWISGTSSDFHTFFKVWREGHTGRDATCGTWDDNYSEFAEVVRFDENENLWVDLPTGGIFPPLIPTGLTATSLLSGRDYRLPHADNGAVAGWMYFNFDDHENARPWPLQNWIVSSLRAEGAYSVDFDAAALGNGCSPQTPRSEAMKGTETIGPRP